MTVAASAIPVLDTIKDLGPRYRAWLVDIWGVMHNGRRAFSHAVAATRAFREEGGIVLSGRLEVTVLVQLRIAVGPEGGEQPEQVLHEDSVSVMNF